MKFDINYQFDVVESAIDYMYKYADSKILLTGNTTAEEQKAKPGLGLQRAQSIKDYMVKKGISEYRIKVNNARDTKPFSTELDGQPVQQNSRVDIYLIK
jgi:outer membrane protein OmpA-like peptidoglycan-associated protein